MMKKFLLPSNRSGLAIITGEKFKVENVDRAVTVEIGSGGRCRVVAHADGHGIELVNNTIVVNITSRQADRRHGSRVTSS